MTRQLLFIFLCTSLQILSAQEQSVRVQINDDGYRLIVDERPFMINGMNWDYYPIGTNYEYSLWNQPESFIKAALDYEMSQLQKIGVNAIRQYTGIPSKWITYIYEEYGIYTLLNHSFGRYGLNIEGKWISKTDYSDQKTHKALLEEITVWSENYKGTPGLLMYMLGNENNYGLFWAGAETEDFPDSNEETIRIGEQQGRPMYRLMNEAARIIQEKDPNRPVAICNGDVKFIDIIAEECTDVDVFGTNTYRGLTFTDLYEVVKEKLDMPVMLTEFGSDAYDSKREKEDQKNQALYLRSNWMDIYSNAAGMGKAQNSIGGFTFQFSDGWWKYGQTRNLDKHDTIATWANAGYSHDYTPGNNNMNEEWFGICAKGPTNADGSFALKPRAAFFVLASAHSINPYQEGMNQQKLNYEFQKININEAVRLAQSE
jgi:hypothetical protein